MESGVNIICFAASYAVALAIEVVGGWRQIAWRRWGLLLATTAGLVAHTWYLGRRVAATPAAPLASPHDWFLVAAWLLAVIALAAMIHYPGRSLGLFLLPATLALIGGSLAADDEPLATFAATRFWGILHSYCLLLGFLAVLLGFLAGMMYLLQSRRLKSKTLPATDGFRLPSLEWLERANSRALGAAAALVGLGFVTGVVLRWSRTDAVRGIPWTDPVALSLAAMLLWLLVAEGFRLLYPAARGRKVAYLTTTAFAFLLLTLALFTLYGERLHGVAAPSQPPSADGGQA
ncbi:MAG: cytochrome c biogenesis protein CcsA [Planctomycetales bacterium]|nr:cytochrome c biogenesis protein CcsA [Planctomycetales bacterium]